MATAKRGPWLRAMAIALGSAVAITLAGCANSTPESGASSSVASSPAPAAKVTGITMPSSVAVVTATNAN
jgi:hypothetical protein